MASFSALIYAVWLIRRTPLLRLSPVSTFLRLNKLGWFGFEIFLEREKDTEREENRKRRGSGGLAHP